MLIFVFPLFPPKNSQTTKKWTSFPLLPVVLLRPEFHLICRQHWQHWPEWRVESSRGNLCVTPPQGVHAGDRQPVERVGSGCQQPSERDQHSHLSAGLHPKSGRHLGPFACSTPQHLCWWEKPMQHYLIMFLLTNQTNKMTCNDHKYYFQWLLIKYENQLVS